METSGIDKGGSWDLHRVLWVLWLLIPLRLLLLSCFSRIQLCVTPLTAAHQAPRSLGFSRQEHWSGLPFPSSMHESEKWKWSRSVESTLRHPLDCSLPGSSIHWIFQARVLEGLGNGEAFNRKRKRRHYYHLRNIISKLHNFQIACMSLLYFLWRRLGKVSEQLDTSGRWDGQSGNAWKSQGSDATAMFRLLCDAL